MGQIFNNFFNNKIIRTKIKSLTEKIDDKIELLKEFIMKIENGL